MSVFRRIVDLNKVLMARARVRVSNFIKRRYTYIMKVLFVCRGNVGRSQMGAAIYNKLTTTSNADSAGTRVDKPGQTLLERKLDIPGASFVVDVMNNAGIDISNEKTKQLTTDIASNYDIIINMAGKKYTPKWLSDLPNYTYWKVRDPMGRNYQVTENAMRRIRIKVKDLLKSE